MKYILSLFFLLTCVIMVEGQTKSLLENAVITSEKKKTQVGTNENGKLHVNVSPKDVSKFKAIGLVRYSDFGAKGDGKTDDIDAIAATHAFANQQGLLVKTDEWRYLLHWRKGTHSCHSDRHGFWYSDLHH